MRKINQTGGLVGWLGVVLSLYSSTPCAQEITLVSAPDDPLVLGTQGAGSSDGCSLSAQGRYVAFTSRAPNLVPDDTNGVPDVFVRDRLLGSVQRVNRFANGSEAQLGTGSSDVIISRDGRVVVFVTFDNLIDGESHSEGNVLYWLDRANGEFQVVSRLADGTVDGVSSSMIGVSISADGRYVVFEDTTDGYVASDSDGVSDVFRYDAVTRQIHLVSTDGAGVDTDLPVFARGLSNDGDRVLLMTAADWVVGDGNFQNDAFVKSVSSGTVIRVSVDSNGLGAFAPDNACDLSGDGESALFLTSDNFDPGDINALPDLYLHRPTSGNTVVVNSSPMGEFSDAETECGFVDAGGSNAAFSSAASTFVGPVSGSLSPYFKDLSTGEITLLAQASGNLLVKDLSDDASTVCLESDAVDVVAGDINGVSDVFVVEPGQIPERISVAENPIPLTSDPAISISPAMSAAGDRITFASSSRWLDAQAGYDVPGAPPARNQIYLHDVSTGDNVLLSRGTDGGPANGTNREPAISANGRYVAFRSTANNLIERAIPSGDYVYRVNVDTQEVALVSMTADGGLIEGRQLTVSNAGSVAFMSDSSNVLPDVTNETQQIVFWQGPEEPAQVITFDRLGDLADEPSQRPHLSSDGNYLVFVSEEADLVDSPISVQQAVFLHDLSAGVTQRIALAGSGGISRARLSEDGRLVVYDRRSDSGTNTSSSQVFLYDRVADAEVSLTGPDSTSGIEHAEQPVISDDGSHVLFKLSSASPQTLIRLRIGAGWDTVPVEALFFGPDFPDPLSIDNTGTRIVFDTSTSLVAQDTNSPFPDVYRVDLDPISFEPGPGLPFADSFEARPLP